MSAQGIAQIAVVMGSCTAGGAYVPAMSDQTIIVKEQGTIFLAGPPLVKAATGEIVDAETSAAATPTPGSRASPTISPRTTPTRWRWPGRRCATSGRRQRRRSRLREAPSAGDGPGGDPRRRPGRRQDALRHPRGDRPHRRRLATSRSSRSASARRSSAASPTSTACPVGIVANNGVLFSESSQKGAHFIELCCQRRIPLALPAEHHRLHGRARSTRPAASPGTAPSSSTRCRPRRCRRSR